jgi:protein CpxP
MMTLLLTPLLATAVAADRHADVWARRSATAQAPVAELAAPMQLAQAGPPPVPPRGDGPPYFVPTPGPGEYPPGPPYLRALVLTEAQQDRIFEVLHAQAPQLRQQSRELAKARAELNTLARVERFDEARAAAAAEAAGRALAAIALIHARGEAAIWQVLTPEQRAQAAEVPARPHPMPPPHGAMRPPQ